MSIASPSRPAPSATEAIPILSLHKPLCLFRVLIVMTCIPWQYGNSAQRKRVRNRSGGCCDVVLRTGAERLPGVVLLPTVDNIARPRVGAIRRATCYDMPPPEGIGSSTGSPCSVFRKVPQPDGPILNGTAALRRIRKRASSCS